jgi:osmotically inducible protein OsmC
MPAEPLDDGQPDVSVSRCATAEWSGTLEGGYGTFTVDSGAFEQQVYTLGSRVEEVAALTSPEELLAAAQASCLAMTFASLLDFTASPGARVAVDATATTRISDGIPRVTGIDFLVRTIGVQQSRDAIEASLERALHLSSMAGSLDRVAAITAELTVT